MIEDLLESQGFKVSECPCDDHPRETNEIIVKHSDYPNCKVSIEFDRDESEDDIMKWYTYTLEAIEYGNKCFIFKHCEDFDDDDSSGFKVFSKRTVLKMVEIIKKNFEEIEASKGKGFEIFKAIQFNRDRQRKNGLVI